MTDEHVTGEYCLSAYEILKSLLVPAVIRETEEGTMVPEMRKDRN